MVSWILFYELKNVLESTSQNCSLLKHRPRQNVRYNIYEPGSCCTVTLFYICVQGVGENACAKKSHEKYLIALKGSGLAFPEDKLTCGMQEQGAGTSTLAVQGLCKNIF